jgi:hypothetical protein
MLKPGTHVAQSDESPASILSTPWGEQFLLVYFEMAAAQRIPYSCIWTFPLCDHINMYSTVFPATQLVYATYDYPNLAFSVIHTILPP